MMRQIDLCIALLNTRVGRLLINGIGNVLDNLIFNIMDKENIRDKASEYVDDNRNKIDSHSYLDVQDAFYNGAKWMKKQLTANNYCINCNKFTFEYNGVKDKFIGYCNLNDKSLLNPLSGICSSFKKGN
jgi:hypothetical protein